MNFNNRHIHNNNGSLETATSIAWQEPSSHAFPGCLDANTRTWFDALATLSSDGSIVIETAYDATLIQHMKALKARFNPRRCAWTISAQHLIVGDRHLPEILRIRARQVGLKTAAPQVHKLTEQRMKKAGYSQRLMHEDQAPGAGEIFRLGFAAHVCTWVDRPFVLWKDRCNAGICAMAGDLDCKVYSRRATDDERRCLETLEQARRMDPRATVQTG